ncbi:MAG TPA: hypothetical protein VE646_00020 [Actinomycetota bacterium]|jgi:hypothetical protein|nr:hypothetical protein [Actinomycetota bacterium]
MRGVNTVAPGDTGKRVSLQFELPNGFVSEVVGTLEAYDYPAETYLVRTKDGSLARVPKRGVRFGKLVPTRTTEQEGPG